MASEVQSGSEGGTKGEREQENVGQGQKEMRRPRENRHIRLAVLGHLRHGLQAARAPAHTTIRREVNGSVVPTPVRR